MPRRAKALTQRGIETARPRDKKYRIHDGSGLLLEVRPSGSRGWYCRMTVDGRRREMGLGDWPTISLAVARAKAREAFRLKHEGLDPIEERAKARVTRCAERSAAERSFTAVAAAFISAQSPGWKHALTAEQWRNSLETHVEPTLGKMPVSEVDRAAVLRAITPLWSTRPATARKMLRRIGSILRYAAANGWRANDNPAEAKLLRMAGLPAQPAGRSQPALPWVRVPAFMVALEVREGYAPLALAFAVLTAMRSGEVRGARWSELTFEGTPTWTIPVDRMKGRKANARDPHRVPLSPAALGMLVKALSAYAGETLTLNNLPAAAAGMEDALIFPSSRADRALSDMSLSAVVKRMNEGTAAPLWCDATGRPAVPHGFRAAFRTWVDDQRPADTEAAEKALAHETGTAVSRVYRRSDLFDRRLPLMAAWGEHCLGAKRP